MNDRSHTVKDAPRQFISTGHVPLLRFATRCSAYGIRNPRQQPRRLILLCKRGAKRGAHIARGARQQYQNARLRLKLLKPDNTAILPHCRRANSLQSRQLVNVLKRAIRLPVLDNTVRVRKPFALQALCQYFEADKTDVDGL